MMHNVKRFFDQIAVKDCGLTKVRIGNPNDGGYVVYEELLEDLKLLFSFGIGDDVGFELDLVERFPDIRVAMFDPTIDRSPVDHERFYFHQQGMEESQEQLQQNRSNIMMKADVEWNEWSALTSIGMPILKRFNQIVVELHLVHAQPREGLTPYFTQFYQSVFDEVNEELFQMYCEVLEALLEEFHIFHAHVNNSLPSVKYGGLVWPPLWELSFIRKDLAPFCSKPTLDWNKLNAPNKTDRLDYKGIFIEEG